MSKQNNHISATEFKKHFLQLVDDVKNNNNSFIVTKRKIPIARVIPLHNTNVEDTKNYYGFLKGTTSIKGDIAEITFESEWEENK